MIRVVMPLHLRRLANVEGEIEVAVEGAASVASVLDAIEAAHPTLVGTMRDRATKQRRPMVRFFACEQDISHEPPDAPLPAPVVQGREPLLVIGAMAGG